MDIIIEPARREDVETIAALEAACFSTPRSAAMIDRALPDFLAARHGGELLGYGDAHCVLDEGYIGNIAVLPEYRRQGVGGALLDALLRRGRENRLSFLTLEVRESNAAARALYAARGFVCVGTRKKYYERPEEDAVLMTYYYEEE